MWQGNLENNDPEETSTEEYDAFDEMHAIIENELYLLQDEETKWSETNEDEMTTTKGIQDETDDDKIQESRVNQESTSTFAPMETRETKEKVMFKATSSISDTSPTNYMNLSNKDGIGEDHNIEANKRQELISDLGNIDFTRTDLETIEMTPRQRLAIAQELEYQQLGLPVFTDPSPWQRLSRSQQEEFNKKFLALSPELQEFSRDQFLSLSERGQRHAYNAFLTLESDTLAAVIEKEMEKVKSGSVRQEQVRNELEEEVRSSNDVGVRRNSLNIDEEKHRNITRPYDLIRQRQPQQRQQRRRLGVTVSRRRNMAQELHLKYARAQLQQAIHLQACLASPTSCRRLTSSKTLVRI